MSSTNLPAKTSSNTTRAMTISRLEVEAKIEELHGRLEEVEGHPNRYCVPQASAPSTVERRQLSAVRNRLEQELEPCSNPVHVEGVISQFLAGFEHGRGTSALNTKLLNERYVKAMKDLPLVAIQAATERFDSGRTITKWEPAFRPSPAQYAIEARAGMEPTRIKLLHVRRVLDAEVYVPPTAEQRAAVEAITKAYVEERSVLVREAQSPRLAPADIAAARESVIRDGVDKLKVIGRDPSMSRLMANLDAKRALGSVE